MADPINSPGTSPIQPTPGPTRKPGLGSEEAGQPPPFSLSPETSQKGTPGTEEAGKPSPMEVARDTEQQKRPQWTPEQMQNQLQDLQGKLATAQGKLSDARVTKNFTDDHYNALSRLADKMTPDLRTIAKNTGGNFPDLQKKQGESVLGYVSKWIGGAQDTLSSALSFLQTNPKPDPASFLKLQYAIQRATQRGELFASIIGAGVSGIKTIMSTQLG